MSINKFTPEEREKMITERKAAEAQWKKDKAVEDVIAREGGPGKMVSADRFRELTAELGLDNDE